MEKQLRVYHRVLNFLLGATLAFQLLALKFVEPWLQTTLRKWTNQEWIVSAARRCCEATAVYSALVLLGLWLYRKFVWKRLFKHTYLAGKWETSFYFDGNERQKSMEGTAEITQTWWGEYSVTGEFRVRDDKGATHAKWSSTSFALRMTNAGKVEVLLTYLSRRSGDGQYLGTSHESRGVETLDFEFSEDDGFPLAMSGHFYGYLSPSGLKTGRTEWKRKSFGKKPIERR